MYHLHFLEFQSVNGAYNGVSHGATTSNVYANNVGPPHNTTSTSAPLAHYGRVTDPTWYVDSGATNHVIQNAGILSQWTIYHGIEKLHIGNGMGLPIHNIGTVVVKKLSAIPFIFIMFCMCLSLQKIFLVYPNYVLIAMFSLNSMIMFALSRPRI